MANGVQNYMGFLRRLLRPLIPEAYRARRHIRAHAESAVDCGDREMAFLPQLLGRSRVSVDVGAYKGAYTWHLLRHSREVHAFEPRELPAALLCKGLGQPGLHVHRAALSDRDGTLTLWIPSEGAESEVEAFSVGPRSSLEPAANPEYDRRSVEVPVRRLDSLALKDVDFIKIHVEGHELAVLEGSRETIERCRPTLLVGGQIRFKPGLPTSIYRYLSDLGYSGYFVEGDRLRPFACFSPGVHQRIENAQSGNRNFIYNFIYVHRSSPEVLDRLGKALSIEAPAESMQ
jgi:FkbM family methyltransferase